MKKLSVKTYVVVGFTAATMLYFALVGRNAEAGIFDLPSFIEPGAWSVGLEPEVIISNGTGAGFNLKPRYGVNDLLDVQGTIGTGAGARKFRLGGTADFEWFPDYENQPGLATALSADYYRLESTNSLVLSAKPMIYKTFGADGGYEYTPFIGLPIGWNFVNDTVAAFMQVAVGTMIKVPGADQWKFTAEAGFNVNDSYSYISGGVTFYQ